MSDDTGAGRHRDGARNWEMVTGLVAVLVGVLALLVSAYTAYLQRRQASAAVWPYVSFGKSDLPRFVVTVRNKGVGPALIKDVRLRLGDKPMRSWGAMLVGQPEDERGYVQSTLSGTVLSAGEIIEAFVPDQKAGFGPLHKAWEQLHGEICYCSVFGDCFRLAVDDDTTEPVAACPAPSATLSFQQ